MGGICWGGLVLIVGGTRFTAHMHAASLIILGRNIRSVSSFISWSLCASRRESSPLMAPPAQNVGAVVRAFDESEGWHYRPRAPGSVGGGVVNEIHAIAYTLSVCSPPTRATVPSRLLECFPGAH